MNECIDEKLPVRDELPPSRPTSQEFSSAGKLVEWITSTLHESAHLLNEIFERRSRMWNVQPTFQHQVIAATDECHLRVNQLIARTIPSTGFCTKIETVAVASGFIESRNRTMKMKYKRMN
jgi:hypothetical protein